MTSDPQPQPPDADEDRTKTWLRRLLLLLLVLLGSFGCMLLASRIALLGFKLDSLPDVRSRVEVDYGAGERRAAPLVPQVIEAVREDEETIPPTLEARQVTVVPVVEIPPVPLTAVAEVTFTPSPTATPQPPPTDTPTATAIPAPTDTQPPTDTPLTVATNTSTPPPSDTPEPTVTSPPTVTSTPQTPTATPVTPTPTSTPTQTPSPTATPVTPTPTLSPTPVTPTPTQTPSATPVTPTDTPTPTPTLTPTHTPLPPTVLAITPIATQEGSASDPDFNVTIIGQNFMSPLTTWLGDLTQNILITVLNVTSTAINGTLSPNIPPGVYALFVDNLSDGVNVAVLPRAFTVYPRPNPNITLDSDVAVITTFGPAASGSKGDDDHVQIIFFEVPEVSPSDTLYVRIFDPDTGGANDQTGPLTPAFDTAMTYTLRGGVGAYTDPSARSDHPGSAGINSGVLITQTTIGLNPALDNSWLALPVNRGQGELVPGGDRRVFKLVIQGAAGDDGNGYQVAISTNPGNNLEVAGARVFAYSWCVMLPASGDEVAVYPYVPLGTDDITQFNFDFDAVQSLGAAMTFTTPLRSVAVEPIFLSLDNETLSQSFVVFSGEDATTWSAQIVAGMAVPTNTFTVWFHGDGATSLAIFTEPTLGALP